MFVKPMFSYDFDKNRILLTSILDISTKLYLKLGVDVCVGGSPM